MRKRRSFQTEPAGFQKKHADDIFPAAKNEENSRNGSAARPENAAGDAHAAVWHEGEAAAPLNALIRAAEFRQHGGSGPQKQGCFEIFIKRPSSQFKA